MTQQQHQHQQQQYYELRQQVSDLSQLSEDLVINLTKVQDDITRANKIGMQLLIECENKQRQDINENAEKMLELLVKMKN